MNETTVAKLAALKQVYAQNLPCKITEIEELWELLRRAYSPLQLVEFLRAVHSLVGSAGTYGYPILSQSCRDLETYLQQVLHAPALDRVQIEEINHLVHLIKNSQQYLPLAQDSLIGKKVTSKLIYYVVDTVEPFQAEVLQNLENLGYQLLILNNTNEFISLFKQKIPAAIVMDEGYLEQQSFIELVHERPPQIPLLCIAASGDLPIRLQAIRAGVSFFIQKPIAVFHLTNQLTFLCDLSVREDYRVLILDDAESLGNYYKMVLEEAGMNVKAIINPHQVMHELVDFKPNLLLLDMYLPECTGMDIAKIIRQEESYVSLPIIFISTEEDRSKQLAILSSCGADDFLTKPVLPQNLIAAVKSRAQRSALLNSYIALDSLTKLLNHTYILKQVSFEIVRAERLHQPLTIAMLDLDHFKQVNDTYGHPVGDLVLKKLAELLLARVRKTDFVGRYGGEEFAIIFPDTEQEMAYTLCRELCGKVASHPFQIGTNTLNITLSIGMAHYPFFVTTDSLVTAADRALYQAKQNGRNRVEFAVPNIADAHLKTID